MNKILTTLRDYFGNEIAFPDNLESKGIIEDVNTGWSIRYVLVSNQDGEPYLDFTANHRMTNPRHHRITSNGEITFLEMYKEAFSYNPNIPGDEEIQKEIYYGHNRNVSEILIKKGLFDV
ncbi:MAG TPA: hypothetical protein PKM63_21095 [Panacibacter sp.]|nr:hypothetical protein [Panacibacter sp.]HNP46808.1 hypothetical protein [Panacibacter sp.]